MFNEAADDSIM